MSALGAWLSGLSRVLRAPALLLGLWLASVALTTLPALMLHDEVARHLGDSLEADRAADAVNFDWLQEFREQATPLGQTLRSDVIGFAAVMNNASAFADAGDRPVVMLACGLAYVLLLWFLTPGIVLRLAANRRVGAQAFLARCGGAGVRLLRLNVVAAVSYAALFGALHTWLFDDLFDTLTHDTTVERTAFFIRLSMYLAFFAAVALVNVVFDYARVRMLVEDRHSLFASINASLRFIARRPGRALGVYVLNVVLLGLVFAAYYMAAPGAGNASWTMWLGFAVSQAYIAARVFTKLAFWAGEAAALQAESDAIGVVRT